MDESTFHNGHPYRGSRDPLIMFLAWIGPEEVLSGHLSPTSERSVPDERRVSPPPKEKRNAA